MTTCTDAPASVSASAIAVVYGAMPVVSGQLLMPTRQTVRPPRSAVCVRAASVVLKSPMSPFWCLEVSMSLTDRAAPYPDCRRAPPSR